MKLLLLSDIHANLTALTTVLAHADSKYGDALPIVHLGDAVDYGMRPRETLETLRRISNRFIANICGNHEMAYWGVEADRFSSLRGQEANKFTRDQLDAGGWDFLRTMTRGMCELTVQGRRILCVHGDASDRYWGKMPPEEMTSPAYASYDFVFSGHTHVPFLHHAIDGQHLRRTSFVNPGSVGQPRNLNPRAQYAVVDLATDGVAFECVNYDISFEQSLFTNELHPYYRDRLAKGI